MNLASLKLLRLLPLVFSVILLACSGAKVQLAPLSAGATIVFLGDSLTYGTGANHGEEDIPALLAKALPYQTINAGVPGDTTEAGLARIEQVLAAQKTDLLIIGLGGNDFLRHVPLETTKQNLKSMIHIAQAQQIKVVLMAIPKPSIGGAAFGTLADHAVYAEIGKEENIVILQDVFSEALSHHETKSDQIHPNAKGYALAEQQLVEEMRRVGLLAK